MCFSGYLFRVSEAELAVKAVVVGTYSRYVGGTYVDHGKMLPKLSRLMFEMCLDFVKTRLKMSYIRHDEISK